MKPDASHHDPRPDYLRALLAQSALSQRAAARLIGISERQMRAHLCDPALPGYRTPIYAVQYALEQLAEPPSDQSEDA
ncbi:MAG: helix-turn-helix domain-containing protein [Rhodanobacter sp.]